MEESPAVATSVYSDETTVLDVALILAESWRTLIFVPLGVGLLALGISSTFPPTYTAITRILPPAQQQSASAALAAQLGSLTGLVGSGAGIKNPADQYVALIRSRTVFDAMIQRFGLMQLYDASFRDDARKKLDRRTRVAAGIKDGLISIEVEDGDAKRAADMANAFVEELRTLTKTLAIGEAAQRRLFFEEQLNQSKNNLTNAELALQASGVSESALRTMPQSALESLARLKAQITAQEIKLSSMRTFMTDANPEFRLAISELSALREELLKAEQSSPAKAVDNGAEYIAKYRDFKYHETLFELMARQYELARLDEAREGAVIQVVDRASPPQRNTKPRTGLITALSIVIAFSLSVLYVFLRSVLQKLSASRASADKLTRLRALLSIRRA